MHFNVKSTRIAFPTFDFVLVVGAIATLFVAFYLKDEVYRDILVSTSASFIFFIITRILMALGKAFRFRRFKRFFGPDATGESFCFVYPNFVLNETVTNTIIEAGIDMQGVYTKRVSAFDRVYRIDIPECVAINDIEALTEFVSLFGEMGSITPKLISDEEALKGGYSFISFGLSSNELTHMYLDYMPHPFFEIHDEDEGARFGEYLRVNAPDGKAYDFASYDRREIGIFLRCSPNPELSERRWFFCAGLGPNATVGAARYVVRNWRRLQKDAGSEDFIAIFSVPPYAVSQTQPVWISTHDRILMNRREIHV
ncbi:hypothetical protein [Methyloceanibacter methanicus]|uniref:hypothetical protein n=1 Tax=Methyloceanibacter methanicus TaxID=1774968 RepID=UPI00114CB44C|nr:hypothetical protein [Methyloceanibacter methanicus]